MSHHEALPVGRILRLLLGGCALIAVWPFFRDASVERILGALLVAAGLAVFYALVHRLVPTPPRGLGRCLGALLAILPLLLVFLLGGPAGQVGALTFLALSLGVAAVRADAGCEVMSIPSLVLGRRTHLVCLLFSPLDWLERRVAAAQRTSPTSS